MILKRKVMKFPKVVKDRIEKHTKFITCQKEYYDGAVINVDKTNITYVEPFKVVIATKHQQVLVLIYTVDDDTVYLHDNTNPVSYSKLELILKGK